MYVAQSKGRQPPGDKSLVVNKTFYYFNHAL